MSRLARVSSRSFDELVRDRRSGYGDSGDSAPCERRRASEALHQDFDRAGQGGDEGVGEEACTQNCTPTQTHLTAFVRRCQFLVRVKTLQNSPGLEPSIILRLRMLWVQIPSPTAWYSRPTLSSFDAP